jgi:hypothetical protein
VHRHQADRQRPYRQAWVRPVKTVWRWCRYEGHNERLTQSACTLNVPKIVYTP